MTIALVLSLSFFALALTNIASPTFHYHTIHLQVLHMLTSTVGTLFIPTNGATTLVLKRTKLDITSISLTRARVLHSTLTNQE